MAMRQKTLGHARTDAERQLEAGLMKAALFKGRDLVYQPVLGGISNTNFCVTMGDDGKRYFVKVPGAGTEMFINRRAAFDASRKASALGIGPRIYEDLAEDGIEINDFLPDRRACTHTDLVQPKARHAVIDTYRRFHAIEPLELTKTVFDMIDEHNEQVQALGAWLPPDHAWLMKQYRLARAALEASGLDLVPCFNDPMPGNFMIDDAGDIMLVDYEYASNNDRCYELGIWFGEMFFPQAIEMELIEAYFGTFRKELYARVIIHKALADIKWALWSYVQQNVSTLDFDFFKYGAWKLLRGRAIMRDPRWVDYITSV
jgi:thiamine kinase-like enzyme